MWLKNWRRHWSTYLPVCMFLQKPSTQWLFSPLIYLLYILISTPPFPSPPSQSPSPLPFTLEKGEVPSGYQFTLVPQVSVGLGISFPTEASQGDTVGQQDWQVGNRIGVHSHSSYWGTDMKTKMYFCCICVCLSWGAGSSLCILSVGGPVSQSPRAFLWSSYLLWVPQSFHKTSWALRFCCGSLQMFWSATGWSSQRTVMVSSCLC